MEVDIKVTLINLVDMEEVNISTEMEGGLKVNSKLITWFTYRRFHND